jgi:asparagine synthase (glutamine-hydrolysing)
MCGLAGLLRPGGLVPGDNAALRAMAARITHRGPDAEGFWTDPAAGVALAHRRLSIIDLSAAGAQPMRSACGRLTLVFNGEIYDFAALRARLEAEGRAPAWRGHSDTEILLAAFAAWGVAATLKTCSGMYALALWDAAARRLTLARDPAGEKPLFVGHLPGGGLVFGSELKALAACPDLPDDRDPDAVAAALRQGYVPAPRTLWRAVEKIMPGEMVEIDAAAPAPERWRRSRHWDLMAELRAARAARFEGSEVEAVEALDAALRVAVGRQMVADAPLGAFLSGGVDSATVVALMQARAARPVQCFTIGFSDMSSEVPDAAAMAAHLGAEHHAETLEARAAQDLLLRAPAIYDEPFTDPSQLPTLLVSAFARRRVTVALTGDGADELFSGYGRQNAIARRWRGGGLAGRLEGIWAAAQTPFAAFGGAGRRERLAARVAAGFACDPVTAYEARVALTVAPWRFVPAASRAPDPLPGRLGAEPGWSALERVGAFDLHRYLPDRILVKVDRAAMAASLETRAPFLDPAVMRLAFSLPDALRGLGGRPKGIVKAVLTRYALPALWDRPKQGFGIPVAAWLRGPFRELAGDLLSPAAVARGGMLDPGATGAVLAAFRGGDRRAADLVWALLIAQLHLTAGR